MSEWISVEERLPENAKNPKAFCPKYRVYTAFGETYGWYRADEKAWYILLWYLTKRMDLSEIDFEHGDVPAVAQTKNVVTHWMPLQKPPKEDK